jgi:hypothetical protein
VARSRQAVLELLKTELEFVTSGGYSRSDRSPWRPPYVFEESPSCPNFSDRARPHRCEDCWLMEFVPPESRDEQVPCRFVQLTADGITIDSGFLASCAHSRDGKADRGYFKFAIRGERLSVFCDSNHIQR